MPLQHYTDAAGLRGILKDEHIRSNDGLFGYGVYFTSLPPSRGQKRVAYNNWCTENNIALGKMAGVIKIYGIRTLSGSSRDSDFASVGDDSGRDVWLYTGGYGEGIDLSAYSWKAFRIHWTKSNRLDELELVREDVAPSYEYVDDDGHGGDECDLDSDGY